MDTNHYHNLLRNMLTLSLLLLFGYAGAQTLTVTSPNGGETWLTETTQTLTWDNSGDPVDILIEYAVDTNGYWYYLGYVSAFDSTNSFSFYNYMPATEYARVRVSDYDDPANSDVSDDFFTVRESPVYFYTPYYGDSFYRTSTVTLDWYSYTLTGFNLAYSTDNGSTWTVIVENHPDMEYDWTVPDLFSDSCFIRITDPADSANYGISPMFSIVDLPTVTLIAPNGGETWNYGQTAEVIWSGTNLPYYLYMEYSTDGGTTWDYLGYAYGADTGGSTSVYVPYEGSENAYVRISDPNAPGSVFDMNDNPFTIYMPPVIVYYPYDGQEFYNQSQISLSWLAQDGIDSLKIELSTDNGTSWNVVEESISANTWGYYWTVSGTPSQECVLRISDADDPSLFGLSGVFTILETPVITLTSPAGDEILNTGTSYPISWEYDNPDAYYVYLEYSRDGGQNWYHIGYASHEGTQGSYNWQTPEIESEQYLIRISDYSLYFVNDTSDMFAVLSFPETPICMVSVDSTTNNNVIVWEKPVSALIDQFIVYRESSQANTYEAIGSMDHEQPGVFIDTNSNPMIKSYRYKLGFTDGQGHVFPMGGFHQTIHLSINQGVGNSWNLIWTSYLGFEVGTYTIYRSDNGSAYEMIASVSGSFNSYSDFQAPAGDVYYIVEVVNPNGCDPAARDDGYSVSRSNVASNRFQGAGDERREISATAYPNPASDHIRLSLREDLEGNFQVGMTDILGRTLFSQEHAGLRTGETLTISTDDLGEGIYILTVRSSDAFFSERVIIRR